MKSFSNFILPICTILLLIGCQTPYSGNALTVNDVDKYIQKTGEDTVCLEDGFDAVCIKVIPGPQGERGKDGRSIVGPPGLPGRDGITTVIHRTEFRYVDVPHPAPVSIPTPVAEQEPEFVPEPTSAKRVVVEAVVHPTNSVHPIMEETTHQDDEVVHVSHLTEMTHTEMPEENEIYHIAIKTLADESLAVYAYPRSLDPNERRNDFSGGTELQGTRDGVNSLLEMYVKEHSTEITNSVGDIGIIDNDLREGKL